MGGPAGPSSAACAHVQGPLAAMSAPAIIQRQVRVIRGVIRQFLQPGRPAELGRAKSVTEADTRAPFVHGYRESGLVLTFDYGAVNRRIHGPWSRWSPFPLITSLIVTVHSPVASATPPSVMNASRLSGPASRSPKTNGRTLFP
jgi:hypothetical protein